MSTTPLLDLAAAAALVLVIEGLAVSLFSSRIEGLLERLQGLDPEQVRWGGLAMAVCGALVYFLVRG